MESKDLITISWRKYKDNNGIKVRKLGKDRYAIDIFKYAIILELWFIRGGLKYD